MSYSKLILWSLLSVSLSFAIAQTQGSNVQGLEKCEYRTFTTTAYYSPKPWQVIYATANLTTEKTLNGHGLYGASGKEVFNGMIAAPQSYPFGDYVVIDGLGIGQIHDRWGAIVSAWKRGHKYDRLDIYMWEGNEGLIKAMTRGVKNVNAYYCEQSKISIPQEDIG